MCAFVELYKYLIMLARWKEVQANHDSYPSLNVVYKWLTNLKKEGEE